jgi:two-component system phosphate regulon sensor histidine kinase PhoR
MKFRTKFLLIYLGTALLVTAILAAGFFYYGENRVRQSFNRELLVQTRLIARSAAEFVPVRATPGLTGLVREAARVSGARVTVVAADGRVIADSAADYRRMENHGGRPEIKAALTGKAKASERFSRTLKQKLVYLAYPLRHQGQIYGALRLARNQAELERLISRLRLVIFGGVLLTVLFPLGFGVALMDRTTKPILELQRMAAAIAKGDLSVRVRLFGSDELAELGLVFNKMAQQLADSFATIHDEKHKLEIILENMTDGIVALDRDLKIKLANPAARTILGIAALNIEDRPIMEVVLNHHLLEMLQEVNLQQTVSESELQLRFPTDKQLQVFLAPLPDQTGRLFGSIMVLRDLTRIRRLERVRQDFVANVSHELRTPIASIKAMAETLLRGAWQDKAVCSRYLEAINNESDRLTNLINDLLALAKLDAKTAVRQATVDLWELVMEVKEQFTPDTDAAPRLEVIALAAPLPLVDGNRDQLKQVLINLVDNAFKYTPSGGQIRISAWAEPGLVKVAVADTGMGIPPEDLGRIFERFYRVDKAHSREVGGTGLGLAIVKHIVESHGGRVEVESSLNRGSVFSFSVPYSEGGRQEVKSLSVKA